MNFRKDTVSSKQSMDDQASPCKSLRQLQRQEFDQTAAAILKKADKSALDLWMVTTKALRQFNLHHCYSEAHILTTAYLRGVDAINKGKPIVNPHGWLRVTAFNYIRELSRDQKKRVELDEDNENQWLQHNDGYGGADQEDYISTHAEAIKHLQVALKRLKPIDQRIMTLKVIENQPWKEIRNILVKEGYSSLSETALRKRKSRVIEALRHQCQNNAL